MIVWKLLAITAFVGFWLAAKSRSRTEISDLFCLSFLAIYLPAFLFNPSGHTEANGLVLAPHAIAKAEISMILVLLTGACVFALRRAVERHWPGLQEELPARADAVLEARLVLFALALSVLALGVFLVSAEFRAFKADVLRFLSFQLSGPAYRDLRNTGYASSWMVEAVLGRARYAVFPLLFGIILYPLLNKGRFALTALAFAVFFVALPASFSKLPVFLFLAYTVLLGLSLKPDRLTLGRLSLLTAAAALAALIGLVILYAVQYPESVGDGSVQPLKLAFERLWSEPYSVVVRYFHVYPDLAPYTGLSGLSLAAQILSLPVRMPDLEVARLVLGPDSGSNPGVFFLGGYAAFGQTGLLIFAASGFLLLWAFDLLGRRIRLAMLRAVFFATVGANVLFLNQIALQTALVTYGLAVLPVAIVLLDRLALRFSAKAA